MDILTLAITAIVIVALIGIGWGFQKLKDKGIINEGVIDTSEEVLHIANAILSNMNFDSEVKDKIKLVTSIVDASIQYAEGIVKDGDKKQITYDSVIKVLTELGIDITDELKTLIDFSVEKSLNAISKK